QSLFGFPIPLRPSRTFAAFAVKSFLRLEPPRRIQKKPSLHFAPLRPLRLRAFPPACTSSHRLRKNSSFPISSATATSTTLAIIPLKVCSPEVAGLSGSGSVDVFFDWSSHRPAHTPVPPLTPGGPASR